MRLINAPLNAASRTIAQFLSDSKNPVRATSCGFESHLRHNTKALQKDKNFEQSEGTRISVLTPSTPISTPTRYDRASSIALAAFAGAAHNVCASESAAFVWQRSRVRVSSGPLLKPLIFQNKRY